MDLQISGNKCQDYFTYLNTLSYLDDHPLCKLLSEFDANNPNLSSFRLKAAQYEILAENAELIVFPETPFYFINNLSPSPGHYRSVSSWCRRRNLQRKHLRHCRLCKLR